MEIKKEKMNIKKYLAAVFVFAFIMFMPVTCHANMQNPVKYLNISRIGSSIDPQSGEVTPSIKIKWEADNPSVEPDTTATALNNPEEIHNASAFEVYLSCISDNQFEMKKIATVPSTITEYEIKGLKAGLVYKVAVRPIHYHSYKDGDVDKNDKLATQMHDDIYKVFLTDPNVSVVSEGTDIVVKFDDAGSWVNYRIFYEQKTDAPFENGFVQDQGVYVDRNSPNTTSTVEGARTKLVYRLTNRNDIKAGKAYSVAVVAYDVPNDDYTIIMNAKPNIFTCATEAPFNIVEESDDYIKLKWSGINTIAADIKAIVIYAGAADSVLNEYARITNDNAKMIEYYLIEKPKVEMNYQIKVIYNDFDHTEAISKVVSYNPSLINIKPGKTNLVVKGDYEGLDLTWDAFIYEGEINFNTYYDILITDDVSLVSQTNLNVESDYIVASNSTEGIRITGSGKYNKKYAEYLTPVKDSNGDIKGYTMSPLKENKVYYIRVIGKTKTNSLELASEPAVVAFYVNSQGNLYMPPVLAKPPLQKDHVTNSSITVKWKKSWYEVTDITKLDANSSWVSKLWVYNDNIYYEESDAMAAGANEDTVKYYDVSTLLGLNTFKQSPYSANFISREVGFGDDIKYEGYVIKQSEVENYIKNKKRVYANYDVRDFIKNCEDVEDIWFELEVTDSASDATKNTKQTTFTNLLSNISYFMLIRSYRIDEYGNKVYATSASSIIATTTLKSDDIEPIPTVPSLLLVETKDISAVLEWKYNTMLAYEIKYSKNETLDGAETIVITNEMINSPDAKRNGDFYLIDVFDLFPETGYYFWIKAKQVIGTLESAWSNPLMFVTATLQPDPITPPAGIGIASIPNPVSDDFIAIEWTRTDEDLYLDSYQGTKIHKNISYVLEIADNIKFLDSKTVELGGTETVGSDFIVMDKSLLKAIGLKSNTRYYVRIKTKITVTEDGTSDVMTRESSFSIIKIFRTKSINEYDSDYGSLDAPLAEKTETIYSGNKVTINILNDERVINEMIKLGSFNYTFDFSKEKPNYSKRKAYIPINVLKAMQARDMNLVIKLNDMSLSVNAKAFNNGDYARLAKSGGVEGLAISINDDNNLYTTGVISKEIAGDYETKYGNVPTVYLEDYMDIQFDTTNATYYGKGDARGVYYDEKTRTWKDAKDQYCIGYDVVFKTGKMGKVGVSY